MLNYDKMFYWIFSLSEFIIDLSFRPWISGFGSEAKFELGRHLARPLGASLRRRRQKSGNHSASEEFIKLIH